MVIILINPVIKPENIAKITPIMERDKLMENTRKIQIVKHIYPGYIPLFEIQVFSNDKNIWVAAYTNNNQARIQTYIEKYYPGLEYSTIDCIHDREN